MYLISVEYDPPVVEASLGGRVDWLEIRTLYEELEHYFASYRMEGFFFILDYSKAKELEPAVAKMLKTIKQSAVQNGVWSVFSIPYPHVELPRPEVESEQVVQYPGQICFPSFEGRRAA